MAQQHYQRCNTYVPRIELEEGEGGAEQAAPLPENETEIERLLREGDYVRNIQEEPLERNTELIMFIHRREGNDIVECYTIEDMNNLLEMEANRGDMITLPHTQEQIRRREYERMFERGERTFIINEDGIVPVIRDRYFLYGNNDAQERNLERPRNVENRERGEEELRRNIMRVLGIGNREIPAVIAEPDAEPAAIAEPDAEPAAIAEPDAEPAAIAEPDVEEADVAGGRRELVQRALRVSRHLNRNLSLRENIMQELRNDANNEEIERIILLVRRLNRNIPREPPEQYLRPGEQDIRIRRAELLGAIQQQNNEVVDHLVNRGFGDNNSLSSAIFYRNQHAVDILIERGFGNDNILITLFRAPIANEETIRRIQENIRRRGEVPLTREVYEQQERRRQEVLNVERERINRIRRDMPRRDGEGLREYNARLREERRNRR